MQIELWPKFNGIGQPGRHGHDLQPCAAFDWFACHSCLKLRSAYHFTNAMMRGKRGKLSPTFSTETCKRVCIDCGIRTGQYLPGVEVEFGGSRNRNPYGIVCRVCRSFMPVLSKMQSKMKICKECLGDEGVLHAKTAMNIVAHKLF